MRSLRALLVVASAAALLAAPRAQARTPQHHHHAASATHLELGVGADYIVDPELGELNLTVAIDRHLRGGLSAGARLGVLVTGSPTKFGAPIDVYLKYRTHGLYFEGLVGPWLLFASGDTLRFHGGVGLGMYFGGGVSAGLEVGFLDHSGIGGLRLSFAF
jgi:hypothetical protein